MMKETVLVIKLFPISCLLPYRSRGMSALFSSQTVTLTLNLVIQIQMQGDTEDACSSDETLTDSRDTNNQDLVV